MTGRQGKQWQLTGQGASAHSLSWGQCQLCSATNTGRMRGESPNQNKGNLVTLKGNTFTVDNRKSPLFLYSAGTTNHTTQYMSCRTETQVQFLSTIWPSPCWNSAAGKGFKHSFKASTHFVSSCLCQLTFFPLVILAMLLLVTFHFTQREGYLPSGVFPLSPSRYTAQH